MRDKDIVGLITVVAFILLFYPYSLVKFIGMAILLFFSPGFFLLKLLYHDMRLEELLLLSTGVSIAVSGAIALLLAAIGFLNPYLLLSIVAALAVLSYLLSGTISIEKPELHLPDGFTALMLAMMLILLGIWGAVEFNTHPYEEIDIAINSWPHNATVNDTLSFVIYVKNQNYGPADCEIRFSLNGESVRNYTVHLDSGDSREILFQAMSNRTGKNLASFDLYVNGEFYTNVHVYFDLRGS